MKFKEKFFSFFALPKWPNILVEALETFFKCGPLLKGDIVLSTFYGTYFSHHQTCYIFTIHAGPSIAACLDMLMTYFFGNLGNTIAP